MNTYKIATIPLIVLTAAGCEAPSDAVRQRSIQNSWMVRHVRESAVDRAIVLQHTVYPYHFESQGSALNELGDRDLAVLASHYKTNPGQLNIPKGDIPENLYSARVASVVSALAQAGVDKERMTISSTALPGGAGMASERVLLIYRAEASEESTPPGGGMNTMLNQGDSG